MAQTKRSVWEVAAGDEDIDIDAGGGGLRLPYIYPGKFLLRVRKVSQYGSARKDRRGIEWFRVDFDVLEGAKDDKDSVSWIVKLIPADKDKFSMSMGDILRFARAVMNQPGLEKQEFLSLMPDFCGEEQPAEGMLVRCEAVNVVTQAGGDFTQTRWYAVEQEK